MFIPTHPAHQCSFQLLHWDGSINDNKKEYPYNPAYQCSILPFQWDGSINDHNKEYPAYPAHQCSILPFQWDGSINNHNKEYPAYPAHQCSILPLGGNGSINNHNKEYPAYPAHQCSFQHILPINVHSNTSHPSMFIPTPLPPHSPARPSMWQSRQANVPRGALSPRASRSQYHYCCVWLLV
jgi:hypothetical protein